MVISWKKEENEKRIIHYKTYSFVEYETINILFSRKASIL
jgi:hypothetical protein